jgi:hypothetical protein
MNVEALYKVNLTPDLAAWYKSDLSRSIDPIVQKSKDLKSLYRSCFPPDFTSNDEPIIWKAYDIMLVKYGKMQAKDYSQSQQASSHPNGGSDSTDDFASAYSRHQRTTWSDWSIFCPTLDHLARHLNNPL